MENSCLTCKYEPDWGQQIGCPPYHRRSGDCKYPIPKIKLPGCARPVVKLRIIRFVDDNSGIVENCATWEKK